jgi:hypothetical protein
VVYLPFAVRAQAPGATQPPASADDVTGAIPSASVPLSNEALAPQDPAAASPPKPAPRASAPAPGAPQTAVGQPKTTQPGPLGVTQLKPPQPATAQALPPPIPVKPPLTGFAAAVKKAFHAWPVPAGKGRQTAELWLEHKDIAAYYAARDYAPLWVDDNKPVAAVAPIKARLALASDDALNLAAIPQADFSGDTDHLAAAEIAFRKRSSPTVARPRVRASIRRTSIR